MASSKIPSETIFSHFWKLSFFENKCWVRNGKNEIFSKSQKKLFHLNLFIRPHVGNLFRMVFMVIAAKFTHFEKSRKNTFLVNAKKWKKWEKWSSKWNHQKVALTNCHYFVNSDPHAKFEEVLTRRFVERESFQQKGTCIIFIVLLHGRGPYPSLIAFFATRDHLEEIVSPHPPDLKCYPPTCLVRQLPRRFLKFVSFRSWNRLMVLPKK